ESLKAALDAGLAPTRAGDRLDVDGPVLREILEENEAPIVANEVLKGKPRERVLADFHLFLDLLSRVEGATVSFGPDGSGVSLEAVLRFLY
ncbi:MAG TPA: hypothetical protein VKF62_05330, partial [Planctomycetota bacterium]|nr:hypothetical protein [Planctomycetota bacterium]